MTKTTRRKRPTKGALPRAVVSLDSTGTIEFVVGGTSHTLDVMEAWIELGEIDKQHAISFDEHGRLDLDATRQVEYFRAIKKLFDRMLGTTLSLMQAQQAWYAVNEVVAAEKKTLDHTLASLPGMASIRGNSNGAT